MNKRISHPGDLMPDIVTNLLDKYGKPKELSINFLPELDKKIWGLHRGTMVVVGGRTSMGKSVFVSNMGLSFALQGKKCVLFSLEMTSENCTMRMMNNYCSIDNWANIAGMSGEDYGKHSQSINEFQGKMKDADLMIVESYGKTFSEIFDVIETMDSDVDVVMIDYIQMIKSTGKSDKQAIDEYLKKLRAYAIQKNFCAVVVSQINRATYDGKKVSPPELWELKSTGALEEIADIAILLHWHWHYDQEGDYEKNDYWIRVAKNREGRTGVFHCRFEPEFSRICEQKVKPYEPGTKKESYTSVGASSKDNPML